MNEVDGGEERILQYAIGDHMFHDWIDDKQTHKGKPDAVVKITQNTVRYLWLTHYLWPTSIF